MKKLYFRTAGQEPDETCIDACPYKDRPHKVTKIGSSACQSCINCYGWDSEENWVKCLKYNMDAKKNEEEEKVDFKEWLKNIISWK